MSNALAIAGVTAVLRDLFASGMIDHAVTDAVGQGVTVTAVAPDRVALEGADARPQLNIFLHQATPNAAWRNVALPSRDNNGHRVGNPPLALDLHYLVTAYGIGDLQAEVLLGYAMQLLHETPMLSREKIRIALNPPSMPVDGGALPSVYHALRASDLADQYEQLKITPWHVNTEDMSKLWSAFQAHYRPTAAYQVSVVLIEASQPSRAPLPVLSRGPLTPSAIDPTLMRESGVAVRPDLMPPFPEIESVTLPNAQLSAHLGDVIVLNGHHLDGTNHRLLLTLPKLRLELDVAPPAAIDGTSVAFTLPPSPSAFPAGTYIAALQVLRASETVPRTSNQVTLSIAPQITTLTSPPQVFVANPSGTAAVTVGCRPDVRPTQRASLIVGSREVPANPHPAVTSTLTFTIPDAPVGIHRVRLRVDGIDSQLVDRSASPPVFLDHRIEIA
jgi:Pvc16 N-terminal domain